MIKSEKEKNPYEAENVPLSAEKAGEIARKVPLWTLEDREIKREFAFQNFVKAMEFVNRVAVLAEELNHHQDRRRRQNKRKQVCR